MPLCWLGLCWTNCLAGMRGWAEGGDPASLLPRDRLGGSVLSASSSRYQASPNTCFPLPPVPFTDDPSAFKVESMQLLFPWMFHKVEMQGTRISDAYASSTAVHSSLKLLPRVPFHANIRCCQAENAIVIILSITNMLAWQLLPAPDANHRWFLPASCPLLTSMIENLLSQQACHA